MNELALIENIGKRLQKKREPVIFPLMPTHRKELRELKERNIGNLKDTLNNIKSIKKNEFEKKYKDDILKELKTHQITADILNEDWKKLVETIKNIFSDRKKLEKSFDTTFLSINKSWDDFSELKLKDDIKRLFVIDSDRAVRKIIDEEFNKKYDYSFKKVREKIDDINTKYEEAINFGDLEIVKELYYIMKSSDNLFKKISKMVV